MEPRNAVLVALDTEMLAPVMARFQRPTLLSIGTPLRQPDQSVEPAEMRQTCAPPAQVVFIGFLF